MSHYPQLIFLGPPGSGKGTQAQNLVTEMGYKHISTGDLLRAEIAKETTLGLKVKGIMAEGHLVSDDIVIELLKGNCDLNEGHYIFDGFPRTEAQAQMLQKSVIGSEKYLAVEFRLDPKVLVERIVNRRTCSNCGRIYNLVYNPPQKQSVCDNCPDVILSQRSDDKESVVTERISVYQKNIAPVIDYYVSLGHFEQIDASQDGKNVFNVLTNLIK